MVLCSRMPRNPHSWSRRTVSLGALGFKFVKKYLTRFRIVGVRKEEKEPTAHSRAGSPIILCLSRNAQSQSRDSHATSRNSASFLRRRGGTSVSNRTATWHHPDPSNGYGVVSTSSGRQTPHSPAMLTRGTGSIFHRLTVLLQRVPCATAHADLRQVVIASQLSQMRLDRVAIRPSRFLDFFDCDFS
jgi:hypothetical protein